MADRRGIIVPLVIIAFILLSPDPARLPAGPLDDRPTLRDVIAREQQWLSVLHNSTWDPRFGTSDHLLNITGVTPEDGFAWDALPAVKSRAQEQLKNALGEWGIEALEDGPGLLNPNPLYGNVTGYVRGKWMRSNLQADVIPPGLNLSAFAPPTVRGTRSIARPFDRNITGDSGDVMIRFSEKGPVATSRLSETHAVLNATEMSAELKISDSAEWDLMLRGVYFPDIGHAILTTTSDKLAGVFMLPHLSLSSQTFESSRHLLNHTISRTIQRQIDGETEALYPFTSATDAGAENIFASPKCDLIVYLQQLSPVRSAYTPVFTLPFLERELRFPTGVLHPHPPDIRFSMLAFSPDCGYVLESQDQSTDLLQHGNHLAGPKMEVQYQRSRRHLLLFDIALAGQLWLLIRQMREASTPSTRSRISFYAIAGIALGDGFITMTFLLISLFITTLSVNLIGTAFLAFISVSFFGMRFLMDIWAVQAPERIRRVREEIEQERQRDAALSASLARIRAERLARLEGHARTGDTPSPIETAQHDAPAPPIRTIDTLPLPVTAPRPGDTGATPIFFMPSDQDGPEPIQQQPESTEPTAAAAEPSQAAIDARIPSFSFLYTRFYLLLLAVLFLSLNATTWPGTARHLFFSLLAVLSLSFWIPQIHRNVQRNCRHALNWEFVAGQSLLRLAPFAYFYGYEQNVLFVDRHPTTLALLTIWVWLQVCVLASQEIIGPRWFVKKDWAPPAWDYHPILREDEEAGGGGVVMPMGATTYAQESTLSRSPSSPSSPVQGRRPSLPKDPKHRHLESVHGGGNKRLFDCAVCMQELEVPVVPATASGDAGAASFLLSRRLYMVTPCRHVFHTACLEGWMKYRLQCPICREGLPPL